MPCNFVGYPNGQKGYRIYHTKEHAIYITRNLTFFENKFSFRNHALDSKPQAQKTYPRLVDGEQKEAMRIVQTHEVENGEAAKSSQPEIEMDQLSYEDYTTERSRKWWKGKT